MGPKVLKACREKKEIKVIKVYRELQVRRVIQVIKGHRVLLGQ
jgi:hypothetical protein